VVPTPKRVGLGAMPRSTSLLYAAPVARCEIPADKMALIATAHNAIVGHGGVKRTRDLLYQKRLIWTHQNTHIRQYLKDCGYCQKAAFNTPPVELAPYTVSSMKPMTVRAIDCLGPFPEDSEGYKYIVGIIDMFGRFLTLYPAKDLTAVHMVEVALLPHIGMFGPPEHLISDNGGTLIADIVVELTALMGTMQVPITPYSHQENSLIERSFGETLRHLRALVYERLTHKDWRRYVPLVQRIFNAQYLPAIGCTPTQMLFGNAIDTNQGIFLEFSKKEQEEMKVTDYSKDLLREQALLIKSAQNLLKAHALERQSGAGAVTEFASQSYVLLKYVAGPNRASKPPTKLHTNMRGPFKVLRHEDTAYYLFDLVTNQARKNPVHVSRLVQYTHNPLHTSPQDVARRDLEDFYVFEILSHQWVGPGWERKLKGSLQFKVSWLGYGSEWDSWEPWSSLRAVKALHRYLHRTGLGYLIPREYVRECYDQDTDDDEEGVGDV
jgi:hypothetical protein